jgi:hypothetical protein
MNLYWIAGLSFMVGVCGYIIVRFWIIPISRYRRAKTQLLHRLEAIVATLPPDAEEPKGSLGKKALRDLRRCGVNLVDLYIDELPHWYRLVLMTRGESPQKAADPILRLENMPTSGQARACVGEIGKHMGLKAFG